MGIFQYIDPQTGRSYNFEHAGEAPTNEDYAYISSFLDQEREEYAQKYQDVFGREFETPDDGTAIGRGYDRGVQQIKQAVGESVGTLGEQTGLGFLESYGTGLEERARQEQGLLSLTQPERMQSTDVKGSFSRGATYFGELVGEQIPQIGLGLGAAVAVPVLTGATGVAAPFLIGAGAAGAVTAPILFGNDIQRQEDEVAAGRKDRVDVSDALVATFGQAALEGVADRLLLGGVLKPIGKSIFTRTISRAGGGATSEGLTEVGQQMLERAQAGLPVDSEDAIAEYREAAIAGGLIGGGTRSTLGAFGDRPADVTPTTGPAVTPTTGPAVTPTTEPAVGATAEPAAAEPAADPAAEPAAAEPAADPTAEPAAEPAQVATPEEAAVEKEVAAEPTVKAAPVTTAKPATGQSTQQKFDQAQAKFRAKQVVTEEMLDDIGVFREASLRKKIIGLDVTDKAVGEALLKYAKNPNPKVKAKADKIKAGIAALLGDSDATGVGTGTGTESTTVGTGAEGSGPSVDQLGRDGSAAGDTREPSALDKGPVGGDLQPPVVPAVADGADANTLAVEPKEAAPKTVEGLAKDVDAIVTKPIIASSGKKDSPAAAEERRRIAANPQAYAKRVQEAKEASGYNVPAEVLVDSDEIAARRATLAEGVADPVQVAPDAGLGGAMLGTAQQIIPSAVPPAPRAAPVIGASLPQADIQAIEAEQNAAAQTELDRRFAFKKNEGIQEYHDTQVNERSLPDTTTATEKDTILALLKTPNTQLKGDANANARAAKLFFKRFRRPVDALDEMGGTSATGPTQQSPEGEKVSGGDNAGRFYYGPKEFKFYEGMTRNAAMGARRWVRDNMSTESMAVTRDAAVLARRDTSKYNPSDLVISVVKGAKSIQKDINREYKKQQNKDVREFAGMERQKAANERLNKRLAPDSSMVGEVATTRLRTGEELVRVTRPVKGMNAFESYLIGTGLQIRKNDKTATVGPTTKIVYDPKTKSVVPSAEILYLYDGYVSTRNEFLLIDPVHGLDMSLLPSIRNALQRGDLQFALNAIASTSQVARVRQIAAKLAEVVGTTKVQVLDDISPVAGRTAAGLFEPDTNTIYLDANNGMNVHTVLHEMAHAATSASLANPALPQTKQLQGLLNAVRAQFGEVYGTRNLDEFVAEAFSNPQFQSALAFLKTDGGRVSGWEKFTTAVRNILRKLMGMQPKTIDSALDEVDRIVNGMLTPSPATRDAPSMLLLSATKAGANKLAQSAANLAPETSAKVADLADIIYNEGAAPKARSFALDMLPVNILTDMAKSKIPFAEELNLLIKQQSGALRKKSDVLDSILRNFHKWQRKNPEMTAILNNIIPQSTYLKVDPSRDDAAYMKTIRDDAERSPEYDKLRAEFLKLDKQGQDFYKQMRNYFQDTYDDIIAALEARLEATISDPTLRQNAFESLRKILQKDSGVIRPYFPLMRKGKYRLAYNFIDADGRSERAVEYFPTLRKAEQASDMVLEYNKSQGDTFDSGIELTTSAQTMSFDKVPSSGFIRDILKSVEFNQDAFNNDEGYRKVMQDLVDLSLDAMPERSFLQNLRRRKGVRGFIGDVTPTGMGGMEFDAYTMMKEKGRDLNRQLVQMKSAAEIEKFRAKLRPYKENPSTAMMANKLDTVAGFASSPNVPQYSQVVNSLGFGFTMGLNFSSAAITFFDVAMSAMPVLAGSHGIRNTGKAFGSATRLFAGAPSKRTVMATGPEGQPVEQEIDMGVAGKSIANYDFSNLPQALKDVRADILIAMGIDQGQFNQSMVQEDLEVGRSAPMETVNKYSSFMFHHSERFNRETTLTAAYMLEVQKLQRKQGQLSEQDYRDAAQKAIDSTEFTLGSTAAAGRPIIAQSGIGNILFLFKRFAVSKYYMMAKLAKEAANDPDPEVRKAARKGGANFLVATGLFAGMGGMPMMGAIGAMYNLFADDDEDDFETMVRQYTGEGIYGGLANEILGVDLANRISLNSLLYRAPIIDKDQSALWTLIEQLGGPVIGVGLSVERGIGQVAEGEVYRGIEAMVPAAVRNGMKSFRFATEGATTRRNDAITSDINPYNVVMQGLGFAPQAYIQQLEANKNARRRADAVNSARTKLLRRRNMAIREGDGDELAKVERLIVEYNAGLPKDADTRKKVITDETKKNSLRTFERTTGDMRGGITTTEFERSILEQYDF